jgi:hypothetical protein
MRIKIALISLATAMLTALSAGQSLPLDIGAPAPTLHPVAWIQGEPVTDFQKGQIYVLVFWNSGFSPYAPAYPRLTDDLKPNVHFISVNTLERMVRIRDADQDARRQRIQAYVSDHKTAIPYSVCVDDTNDSITHQWLTTERATRLPRLAIVDRQGEVAWIGQPMDAEKPLVQICRNTFNKAAYKQQFDLTASQSATETRLMKDIEEAAKANDQHLVDGLMRKLNGPWSYKIQSAIFHATTGNPEFGLTYLKSKINTEDGLWSLQWCSLLAHVAQTSKLNSTKQEALRLCVKCLPDCTNSELPAAEAYHAQILLAMGQKDEALVTIGKARADLDRVHNAEWRGQVTMLVDSVRSVIH